MAAKIKVQTFFWRSFFVLFGQVEIWAKIVL